MHLAHRTKNIKIGCGFNIAPMWHPLRLAEDYAVADFLTGGRVVFGLGRGYHTREVETFGAPLIDQEANRELYEEQTEIIFKAFNEESFSHKGKHYTLPPEVPYRGYTLKELTLVPRPINLPVECWQPIQGGSPRALDFMAKHGIQGMVGGGSAEGGAMHKVVSTGRPRTRELGKHIELGERLCFGFHFYMADSREKGMKEAAKYYEENMKMFGELRLVRALTEEQIEIMRDPKRAPTAKLPRIEDAVKAGGFLCGNADDLIEPYQGAGEEISGARPHLGEPVGRRAGEGRAGAARAVRERGDAGLQGSQSAPARLGLSPTARRRCGRQFGRGQSPAAPMRLMAITACVRLSTPSFCRMAETCALMVASDTPSLKAICLLSSPSPSIMSTRTCCGVSVESRDTSSALSPGGTLLRSMSGGSHTSPPMMRRIASRIRSTGCDFGMKPEAPQSRHWRIVAASSLAETITTGTSGCWARR